MRILGKGKTAQAILNKYPEAILYDDNDKDSYDINSDELTVVSPGIPPSNYLVENTKNLISEYDLFSKDMPYNIWISGTNGKTTTTQMLQHLLEEKGSVCGGNIGTPLASLDAKANIWLLETSSFTLHYTLQAKPNIYILLPISQDHVSWHGSFKEYEQSKLKPLDNLKEGEIAIIPSCYKDYQTNGYKISYEDITDLSQYFNINIDELNFKEPFLMDALLSLAVMRILFDEVDYKKINSFKQDAHKLEEFTDKQGRSWIDDSKATNIDATIQALKGYKNKKIYLILGGDDKQSNLESLFIELQKYNINIFCIGKDSDNFNKLAKQYNIKSTISKELNIAVNDINILFNDINTSCAILSPSAASLDQFESYKHRGKEFKRLIECLS